MNLENPILNALKNYLLKKTLRLHVPFHGGKPNNNFIPKEIYNIDISEIGEFELEGNKNPIFQSEKITANVFNCFHSFYLVNGASSGMISAMLVLSKLGKKVIISRNVHKSVINGIILSGLEPIWLEVDFLEEWGIFSSVNLNKLEKLLKTTSNIAGCVIVSPTYEGVISNVKDISKLCHNFKIPLIVDQAHGSHLFFLNKKNKFSALQLGADIVVESWHKSLGSLTQSGVLHLRNEEYFTYKNIKRSLDLTTTTSPSFLLLISLELTRSFLNNKKFYNFEKLLSLVLKLKNQLNKLDKVCCFNADDPLKIYFKSKNISGADVSFNLYKKFQIEVESTNKIGVLLLPGLNFKNTDAKKILSSIKALQDSYLKKNKIKSTSTFKPKYKKLFIQPRDAFFNGYKNHKLKSKTEVKAKCPPGYVTQIPGEEL